MQSLFSIWTSPDSAYRFSQISINLRLTLPISSFLSIQQSLAKNNTLKRVFLFLFDQTKPNHVFILINFNLNVIEKLRFTFPHSILGLLSLSLFPKTLSTFDFCISIPRSRYGISRFDIVFSFLNHQPRLSFRRSRRRRFRSHRRSCQRRCFALSIWQVRWMCWCHATSLAKQTYRSKGIQSI